MPQAITTYAVPRFRPNALTPEIVDPRIADIEALARWLDYAFRLPGGFRFGIAGIIGLIPGIGDVFDALVSFYIVFRAIQLGISRVAIARMLVNIGIEAAAGSVPFVGDLFDIAFKANRRNYRLLKSHLAQPERQKTQDWVFLIVIVSLVYGKHCGAPGRLTRIGSPLLKIVAFALRATEPTPPSNRTPRGRSPRWRAPPHLISSWSRWYKPRSRCAAPRRAA